jgi:hypothetical protein
MAGTLTTKTEQVQERGTAATTVVPEIVGEYCDACGRELAWVPARYKAFKDEAELFFCAHHARKHEDKLKEQGFALFPEDTGFTAGSAQ